MNLLQEAYARAQTEWHELENSKEPVFFIGSATCGRAAGALDVLERLKVEIQDRKLKARIVQVGCIGPCCLEPVVIVQKPGYPRICYGQIGPEEIATLVEKHVLGEDPCAQWALGKMSPGEINGIGDFMQHPMLRKQVRNVLRNCGQIDPENVYHYLAHDGFRGFLKALEIGPERTLEEVKSSGLRGRGGAGFPTGRKWEFCRNAPGDTKYLICNADEGDPGAFMNRSLLEGNPHAVLAGMLIAAFTIGASRGYIYCRAEYPLALHRLEVAISQMREIGLLGDNILNSSFSFDITIKKGAGAFVCGEETALIASIEGRRGMPSPRPPFPAISGLWGKPTIIQNVETLGNLDMILFNGAEWFNQWGTASSKGTKTFALVGKVKRTGLIEVPLGTKLKDIIYDIGGGVLNDKQLKAVQTGGPSGGCIPAEKLDLPVDYESLTEAGSIMGSGGMIVLDEDTCVVDVAKYFLSFTQEESCGKCPPCRVGTRAMLNILQDIANGSGEMSDLDQLEDMARTVKNGSLCGLGQTAPNPVLTTLRYFHREYEAHILDRRCPAGVCAELLHSPCQNACPAGVDVPLYISLIEAGRLDEGLASHLERNPFPSVCARVCPHPCERKCRRVQLDAPVAICSLKRFLADNAHRPDPRAMVRENPYNEKKKIAVVGAGPAGLTCAYFLRRMGYAVTVFEKWEQPGGMLTYAIPEYRLPRDVLYNEIDWILATGIDLNLNVEVGKDISLQEIRAQGYRAIFLGLGAWQGMELGIPGEELQGVTQGLEFLMRFNRKESVSVGRKVAVIGGGDVAIDAARVAVRAGAEVTVVYRRTRREMPAIESEVEQAQAEGVRFIFLAQPERIEGHANRAEKLICRRMTLTEFALDGRLRPEPTEELFEIEADTIIAAIGQQPVTKSLAEEAGLPLGRSNRIKVDWFTLETEVPLLFAGGDVVSGPQTVVAAIGAGERAACAINDELSKDLNPKDRSKPFWRQAMPNDVSFDPEALPVDTPRMQHPLLGIAERCGFAEIELPVEVEVALKECARCLRCDYRVEG